MVQSKEERAAKRKARYEKNKVEIAEKNKANKEHITERQKIYRKTPAGIKSRIINHWKHRGLIDSDGDNYEQRYQLYLQSTHCDACKNEYENRSDCCMDHDHDTHLYRQFLCRKCNIKDTWKKFICIL